MSEKRDRSLASIIRRWAEGMQILSSQAGNRAGYDMVRQMREVADGLDPDARRIPDAGEGVGDGE